ncbi:MAG: hypothetical protein R3D84_18215 [Paracoccaceae bacterium]
MFEEIKGVLARSSATLVEDMAGVSALAIMLFVGLHLPSYI